MLLTKYGSIQTVRIIRLFLPALALLLWHPALTAAEKQSSSLEIRATVPSYCKFKVDHSPAKGLNLDHLGPHKAHIANIELDCNIVSGYRILANSENEFNLTNEKKDYYIPYRVIIDALGTPTVIDKTSQYFEPEMSTKAKTYAVYVLYDVMDIMAGEYNDNLVLSLDIG